MMKNEAEIMICGDLCPTRDTAILFEKGDVNSLFNNVLNLFNDADLLFGNLEFVLTDNPKPINKSGPNLFASTSYINIIKKAGFNLLSLANNHIKDCGEEGVQTTIKECAKAGIDTFGAGQYQECQKTLY